MKFLVLAVLAIGVNAGDYGYGSHYVPKTYGQTYDVKSDFYNDYTNVFDARHVPAVIVPKVYAAEKSGYATPAVLSNAAPAVLSNAAYGYGDLAYGYGDLAYGYGKR